MLNLAGVFFLAMAFLQPMHVLPWVSWHSEVLAFLALFAMCLDTLVFDSERRVVQIPKIAIAWIVLAAIAIIQFVAGSIVFFGDAFILFLYMGFCVAAMSIGKRKKVWTHLPWALLMVALISTGIALTQALSVWSDLSWTVGVASFRRPGANLGQPNHLATMLLMGVASVVFLFESRKLSASIFHCLLALLLFGVALTESRTGALSFIFMAIWVVIGGRKIGMRTKPASVMVAGIWLGALLWAWPLFIGGFQAGGWNSDEYLGALNASAGTRLVVWPQLIEAVFQRPFLGWGLREVSTAHNAVLHAYATGEAFSYAHNIVLDLAIGIGVPLTVLLVVAGAIWTCRRVRGTSSLSAWYSLALIAPLAVHSMLEFPFAYAYLLLPAMLAVGALEHELAPTRPMRVPFWVSACGAGFFFLLAAWSVVEYVQIEEDFRVARLEALRVGHTPEDYVRPHIVLLTQLGALLKVARLVPSADMSEESIEISRKVAMRFPWIATQNRYALSLALNGNALEASRQLKVIHAMHGDQVYEAIEANWNELADTKYPQLRQLLK